MFRRLRGLIREERIRLGIAVITFAVVGTLGLMVGLFRGGFTVKIGELPLMVQLFAYPIFALCLWSGFQIFDRLLPSALRLDQPLVVKAMWIIVLIALMPIGPLIYYAAVYRRMTD